MREQPARPSCSPIGKPGTRTGKGNKAGGWNWRVRRVPRTKLNLQGKIHVAFSVHHQPGAAPAPSSTQVCWGRGVNDAHRFWRRSTPTILLSYPSMASRQHGLTCFYITMAAAHGTIICQPFVSSGCWFLVLLPSMAHWNGGWDLWGTDKWQSRAEEMKSSESTPFSFSKLYGIN